MNETREAIGAGEYIPGARAIQIDQWEDVMGNVKESLGIDEKGKSKVFEMKEIIVEYELDTTAPMDKGKAKSVEINDIDE